MKKVILSSIFGLMTILGVNAQADSDLVQVGVKGGVNFSNVTGDDFEGPNSRTSFNAGFVAEIPFTERFSIQPEVLYSGQGFDIDQSNQDNFLDNDGNVEYQLDYIQIPVLAKIYLVEGLSVQAGPQIGFKINEEIDYQPNDDAGDIDLEDYSETEDIDISLAAGLEYKFDNGFFIQGRYNYGFSQLIKDYDIHNSVFQAGIGFMF
ncbi:Outer membrane protein beta-barrel domain-containing protein [Mesonia phycicola]|uniref:Outer membrane protein beta-barrel domain-containing protein n=1 Tax=Mesonia phycicola TaxID=579105 RepID=A0A1M6FG90_9FLAO|nr:porin family protein [Mesonia phycicola]SHI96744.1 Outer membrane protein beta-barrel domain-containing protein [Mesonia phycicola]